MTREQYLQHRNNNQMIYELFWEYYQNNCDNPLITDFQTFIQAFSHFNTIFPVLQYEKVFRHYDNKFNVMKIMDLKTNQIIRYE